MQHARGTCAQALRIGHYATLQNRVSLNRATVSRGCLQARDTSSSAGPPDGLNPATENAGVKTEEGGEGTPSRVPPRVDWIHQANTEVRPRPRIAFAPSALNHGSRLSLLRSLRRFSAHTFHSSTAGLLALLPQNLPLRDLHHPCDKLGYVHLARIISGWQRHLRQACFGVGNRLDLGPQSRSPSHRPPRYRTIPAPCSLLSRHSYISSPCIVAGGLCPPVGMSGTLRSAV